MAKDPFNGMFDDLFGDFFGSRKLSKHVVPGLQNQGGLRSYSSDSDDRGMYLYVDLPGIDPKTIKVEVGGSQVVVSGANAGKTFTNRYTLSDEFDVSTASAAWRHGRLDVRILRSGRPEFKKIPIEIK